MNDEDVFQLEEDALERYWSAVELADGVRAAWVEAGSPLTLRWANGVESEAPLLRLLRQCERECERFARALPRPERRPGRKPVAVLGPSAVSPSARLRSLP